MNIVTALSAVQQIRRMRGGSQSQLMRASDGHFYITKFQGNPQHTRGSRGLLIQEPSNASLLRFAVFHQALELV